MGPVRMMRPGEFAGQVSESPVPAAGHDPLPDWFRNLFVVAAVLLVVIRAPFHDLAATSNLEISDAGNLTTQIFFSLLGLAVVVIVAGTGLDKLRPIATPSFWLLGAWYAITIALSVSPALSLRRAILVAISMAATIGVMLVARTVRHFAGLVAGTSLAVVVASYLAVALVPDLATHTAVDLQEPEHAGAWRGLFPHKNDAGAVMAVFVLIGLFAYGAGRRALGVTLAASAALFLAFTQSKTAVALLPLVLASTGLASLVRTRLVRAVLLLGPLTLVLVGSLGSVFVPEIQAALSTVLSDVTFTGRSEIWKFAVDHIRERPITGWGLGAFWRSEETLYAGSETLTWVNNAEQAHNGYLDLALIMGLPGLALATWVFIVGPFRDLDTVLRRPGRDPTALFFARLWLFGLTTAAFESIFFYASAAVFFLFAMAMFGLRYLAACGPSDGPISADPPTPLR